MVIMVRILAAVAAVVALGLTVVLWLQDVERKIEGRTRQAKREWDVLDFGLANEGLLRGENSNSDKQILVSNCLDSVATGVSVGLMNREKPSADCASQTSWFSFYGFSKKIVSQGQLIGEAVERGLFKGRVLFDRGVHISENLAVSVGGLFDLLPVAEGDPALIRLTVSQKEMVNNLPVRYDFRQERDESTPGGYFTSHGSAMSFALENLLPYSNNHYFAFRAHDAKMVPYIAMERLLAVFLEDIPTKCLEYKLTPFDYLAEKVAKLNGLKPFLDLTSSTHWNVSSQPLNMMGFAPGLVEATGVCTRNGTMGVVCSDHADSLSILHSIQKHYPKTEVTSDNPVKQNAAKKLVYDKKKIYVAHIVSDGDNLSLLQSTLKYLKKRKQLCEMPNAKCPPRSWTISARISQFSPAIRKFYDIIRSSASTRDSFLMPPSGSSYFYPASATDHHGLEQHQRLTIEHANLLDIEGTILWDLFINFSSHLHKKYLQGFIGSKIKAVFFSSAPWLLSPNEDLPFTKLGYKSDQVTRKKDNPNEGVIVFKELTRWDGVTGQDAADGKHMSIEKMAELAGSQPAGSLNFIYDISWGISVETFHEYAEHLAKMYPDTVLVDHRTLIDLARQKYGLN